MGALGTEIAAETRLALFEKPLAVNAQFTHIVRFEQLIQLVNQAGVERQGIDADGSANRRRQQRPAESASRTSGDEVSAR
jgi:hypothetical protein